MPRNQTSNVPFESCLFNITRIKIQEIQPRVNVSASWPTRTVSYRIETSDVNTTPMAMRAFKTTTTKTKIKTRLMFFLIFSDQDREKDEINMKLLQVRMYVCPCGLP